MTRRWPGRTASLDNPLASLIAATGTPVRRLML
jgi:hypothetical protein